MESDAAGIYFVALDRGALAAAGAHVFITVDRRNQDDVGTRRLRTANAMIAMIKTPGLGDGRWMTADYERPSNEVNSQTCKRTRVPS